MLRSLWLVALTVLAAAAGRAQSYDFAPVDDLLAAALERVGGGVVLVMIQDDQTIYRQAFGNLDFDSVIPIASASKILSAAAVMSLADSGVWSLDTPIRDVYPSWRDVKGTATIRQCFAHTSGIIDNPGYSLRTWMTLDRAVRRIHRLEPYASPGEFIYYAGNAMQVVGGMGQTLEARPWAEIFEARIAAPLGMQHTDYNGFGETQNPGLAGSMQSNANDYIRFVQMLMEGGMYNGQRVLSPEAIGEMFTDQTAGAPIAYSPVTPYLPLFPELESARFGVGCWVDQIDANTGQGEFITSPGAFGATPFIDRARQYGGVYMVYQPIYVEGPAGPYNDATVVFYEMKRLLDTIIPVR